MRSGALNLTSHHARRAWICLLIAWWCCSLPSETWAQSYLGGTVSQVVDGDTLTLTDSKQRRTRIRLAGIDAPECSMPSGGEARQHLLQLALGHEVQAHIRGFDRYGRTVAIVELDGSDLNLAMIAAGWAWHDPRYTGKSTGAWATKYAAAQGAARAHGLGLWDTSSNTEPWKWRRNHAGYRRGACGVSAPAVASP